jgi:anaerobic magnesium-protoporphyrin IX monomethyl ester cyclase
MKITLISLDRELYVVGVRILASCLREKGHQVQIIFMPPEIGGSKGEHKFQALYSETVLAELVSLCSDSNLIGVSLLTNQFIQASYITKHLKKNLANVPIIWGGIHPTVEPEVCLEFADIVCIGEGEQALVELAELMEQEAPYLHVKNMWFKSNGETIRNPLRPLIQDLDALPFPDYSEDHFVLAQGHIVKLTPKKLIAYEGERYRSTGEGINYPIMTSRGCPFACTYCCNSVYHRLYPGQKHLRWRSVNSVIEELRMVQTKVGPISCVLMVDDNLTARPESKLKDFFESYKREIGVPFFAQVSPLTINDEKMRILLSSGCIKVVMGVETGNARIARMYNREKSHAAVQGAISVIEKYRKYMPLPPSYQFIIDNPYETIEESIETLQLAVSLPQPWSNPIYSLMLFPGTPLYEKALSDGLISNKMSEVYGKNWHDQSRPFFQFWIRLYRANVSPLILRLLLAPRLVRLMSNRLANKVWRLRAFRWLWNFQ